MWKLTVQRSCWWRRTRRETQRISGQNVRDAFPLGDVFIDATSRNSCMETLRRFIHLLFGNNEITPTHDEYGMYMAKSASLRSSDLSRQIGAAIFSESGEIATMGLRSSQGGRRYLLVRRCEAMRRTGS